MFALAITAILTGYGMFYTAVYNLQNGKIAGPTGHLSFFAAMGFTGPVTFDESNTMSGKPNLTGQPSSTAVPPVQIANATPL